MLGSVPGVSVIRLMHKLGELYFVSNQTTGDDHLLTPHYDNLLSSKKLLGDDTGQATKKVTFGINYRHVRHISTRLKQSTVRKRNKELDISHKSIHEGPD